MTESVPVCVLLSRYAFTAFAVCLVSKNESKESRVKSSPMSTESRSLEARNLEINMACDEELFEP